jgi:two-component system sensor histidine kinase ChvG
MGVLAIVVCLIIFSVFLNYVILKPIRSLASSARRIQDDFKSKPTITDLDKRSDEIGDLSKILNEMLNNLYLKIDNTENYSADLMHEIRNPLASIKMASEVITDNMNENEKKFLNLIQTDISRIENIITDYSSMIKDEALLSKSTSKKFDIIRLISEIIKDYQQVNKKNIQFKYISDQEEKSKLLATGQRSFIRQAIENIIENALSFSNESGVITISLSATSNYLTISITDNGPGIKEPNIDRIFDRFYSLREDDQLITNIHSGLGLNIAKQIVGAHGGYVSAHNISSDNVIIGAKFIINLPLGN